MAKIPIKQGSWGIFPIWGTYVVHFVPNFLFGKRMKIFFLSNFLFEERLG